MTAPLNPTAGAVFPYTVGGATPDCSKVVFETNYAYPGVGASGLYAWSGGSLHNVGVLPDGSVAQGAHAGSYAGKSVNDSVGSVWRAVSDDASRIFFTATSNEGADSGTSALFARIHDSTGERTVDVSQSQTAVPGTGALFQLASRSGDHVLFLANYGIASTTSAGPTDGQCTKEIGVGKLPPCDLYDYNVSTGELVDLSADANPLDANGAVVAGVLGASDDASWVYFAAQGQLVAGKGRTYAQNDAAASFNVYLTHGGQRSFVGLLDKADLVGYPSGALIRRSRGNATGFGASWRSRVTPDGRRLLFSSSADVIGYDSGGVAEAYVHSADSGQTVCISCRPDGASSVGDPITASRPTAPLASAGDAETLSPHNPPRSLSDDGSRAFFTMPDALADGAVEGAVNVYEWQDGQVRLLTTGTGIYGSSSNPGPGFMGASASGDDVFIRTNAQLVPQDPDLRADIYDARVGGGFAVPPARSECDPLAGDACPGPTAPPPAVAPVVSAVFSGAGNLPAPPAPQPKPKPKRLRVMKPKTVRGASTRVKVKVPEEGKIRTSGSGLRRSYRTAKRAGGTYRVAVRLSKRARRTLRRKGRVRVRVTVRFSPEHGKRQRERVHVTFKAKRSKHRRSRGKRRAVAVSRGTTVHVGAHGKVR